MSLKHWQRRPSALSRQALAVYTMLVVYGSLYPFSGWRSQGIGPFAYLTDPLPQYLTAFDVITNVLGYMPFGALAVLALYPRWRGALAAGVAFIGGAMLSGSMEAVQTYLPTRVASNLDLAANALGALLGAALTAPATSMLLDRGLLRRMRFMWFERDAAYMIGLSGLWPFAAMYPAPFLFAVGDLPRVLWLSIDPVMQDALLAWTPAAWNVAAWPAHLGAKLPDAAWETLITSLNLFAALVLATLPMRTRAPRVRLLLGLVLATLGAKAGATFLQSRSGLTLNWATDGAIAGIAFGTLAGVLSLRCSRAWRATLAGLALIVALVLVNLLPVNPYFDIVLADWRQGRYLHFNGLSQWLAWVWPYAALGWLASTAERAFLARRRHGGEKRRSL
ncbi:VanZ like family protein [Caballeronia sp. SBC1]|uniref:VanZ family protein n=1 Tax=unclassified Caballeronia TaxID=2646786 RepID=UPI0013E1A2F6|nr:MULTISPECIES: VanZ family protein [unclassified Caballeronia]QIE22240.1 VanZ like family protein [Caballeronia sp. SBC2]QIN60262.1 VanZ like family protein [Caballeronia sp. SBC1]